MSTTNILDLNNRIDALEKISHNVEPIKQQIDELKAWTDSGTKDASGNPIILTDGAELEPTALTVTLEESEDGYTECVVDREGFNWWDEEWELGTINPDTGATEANNSRIRSKNYVPVLGGVTYYFKCPSTSSCRIAYYDASKNRIGGSFDLSPNITFTTPSDCAYLKFSPNNDYGTTYNNNICINVSDNSLNGQYEPYVSPTSATIIFGETVNAGSVDFITGIVTVTSPEAKTLTLTPDNITLLKGYNVISSSGSIALSYHPDNLYSAELVMDNRIAALEEKIFILAGGTTGQVLTKNSDDNYDATWETLPATRTTTRKSEK